MKKIVFIILFLSLFLNVKAEENIVLTWWIDISSEQDISYEFNSDYEVSKYIKTEVSMNTPYELNLTELYNNLKIIYPEKEFRATWDIKWASSQEWFELKRNFREKWQKEILLTIYEINDLVDANNNPYKEEKIFFEKTFNVLVFEKIIPLIYSENQKDEIDSYIEYSKQDWVYIYKIWEIKKDEIETLNITNNLTTFNNLSWLKSDYIWIWWDRDFVFDILWKINSETATSWDKDFKLNIVVISPYNIDVLKNYLRNFLTNKNWIQKIILLNENSKFLILKQNYIEDLIKNLDENKHEYIDIDVKSSWINKMFFISNFVNSLSNLWYSSESIYLFLLIPFLFTIISFFKHFIWISPIWIVIPVFLTILFLKVWVLVTLILLWVYLTLNLLISVITSRYNLLYTPKVSFIISINVIAFICLFNFVNSYSIINLSFNDMIYFTVFIIISEKIINILLSKDLSEYKESFFYTIWISLFCFLIFYIWTIKIFLLAYPEVIMLLVPINFLIWRFTWLRVTEYFRFKEIIKNIEE